MVNIHSYIHCGVFISTLGKFSFQLCYETCCWRSHLMDTYTFSWSLSNLELLNSLLPFCSPCFASCLPCIQSARYGVLQSLETFFGAFFINNLKPAKGNISFPPRFYINSKLTIYRKLCLDLFCKLIGFAK